MEKPVSFNSEEKSIFANLSVPRGGAPGVLLSHGLEGSKDGTKWLILASRLPDSGYASLRFNYRGSGEGPEKSDGEPDAGTLTERLKDYKAAIQYFEQTGIDAGRVGAIGSSFGGMVVLAAQDPRVRAMVILATPSHMPQALGGTTRDSHNREWLQLQPGVQMRYQIYEDAKKYDIRMAVKNVGCPLLILHGSADQVVPVDHARELYRNAREPKKLVVIEGANHSFDTPEHLEKVVALILEWFNKYL